ncbi:hypothetical protein H8L32_16290 [Undibacterium sp. CY18W]|uniref:Uncharacterized protein n=1 Tax=Undibacterium hunanense TaxID=2762292 RepID=A0ABR6ZT65_9BURK|nr:hypothetical protein [Undibacterium hunanense]MBC3919052.1 hypothetical protein [Undibacterium hunanense]
MSYLTYPRLHFSGGFLADPSTVNNTPDNYTDANNDVAKLQLYWNPNGTGIFDFQSCLVTKVVYGPGDETTDPAVDPVIGQPVNAVYTMAAPKLVDLDPDQQNTSEIWGLSLQVAGITTNPASISDFVRGDYVAGSYNAVWAQAINGPRSSGSGCGVYQSSLTNLSWTTAAKPQSKFLSLLQQQSPQQLSVNFVVNAHNNAPVIYLFNKDTLQALEKKGVPATITAKLLPMTRYYMNLDSKGVPANLGSVPTESYVNNRLTILLGQADADTYRATILATTLAPPPSPVPPPNINTLFPTGLLTGTIGPLPTATPVFYTPSRMMAPVTVPNSNAQCNYAPFCTQEINKSDGSNEVLITVNLGNSLATDKPGYNDPAQGFGIALSALGELFLVYFDQNQGTGISLNNAVTIAALPNDPAQMAELMTTSGGILTVKVDPTLLPPGLTVQQAEQKVLTMPLGLMGKKSPAPVIWLAENINGYNLRADQFVFRMNPGIPTSPDQPNGATALVRLYATRFGQPAANISLQATLMSPEDSVTYTSNTMGTGGTSGLKNIAIPQNALSFNTAPVLTNAQGMVELKIVGTDPGFPRASQNVDGQIYFVRYNFADQTIAKSYTQHPDDLISILLFSQQTFPENPTWDNCIQTILPQYAKLYPIMGRFKLDDYATVVQYAEPISVVLAKPIDDALHMPVIRDLSIQRTQVILKWFANKTPK